MPKHFVLQGFVETEPFRSPSSRGSDNHPPYRNRVAHGAALGKQIDALKPRAEEARLEAEDEDVVGLTIEFESFPNLALAFESLAMEQSGIELLNVRSAGGTMYATVFVPDGKLGIFESLLESYMQSRTNKLGHPIDNQKLIDTIQNIRAASVRSMWTDTDAFPTRVAKGELLFPERTVVLLHASPLELQRDASLLGLCSVIALAFSPDTWSGSIASARIRLGAADVHFFRRLPDSRLKEHPAHQGFGRSRREAGQLFRQEAAPFGIALRGHHQ